MITQTNGQFVGDGSNTLLESVVCGQSPDRAPDWFGRNCCDILLFVRDVHKQPTWQEIHHGLADDETTPKDTYRQIRACLRNGYLTVGGNEGNENENDEAFKKVPSLQLTERGSSGLDQFLLRLRPGTNLPEFEFR